MYNSQKFLINNIEHYLPYKEMLHYHLMQRLITLKMFWKECPTFKFTVLCKILLKEITGGSEESEKLFYKIR